MSDSPPAPETPLGVFVADDHAAFVDGLVAIVEGQPHLRVVGVASDGEQAVVGALALRPHVVLMDLVMPGLDGITATARILARAPETRVIVVTMHASREHVERALRVGARGYLLKESAGRELLEAVRRVAAGEHFLGEGVEALLGLTPGSLLPPYAAVEPDPGR